MKNQVSTTLKMNRIISGIITVSGIILIAYMARVEGEFGALPLFLATAGFVWFLVTQGKIKRQLQKNK